MNEFLNSYARKGLFSWALGINLFTLLVLGITFIAFVDIPTAIIIGVIWMITAMVMSVFSAVVYFLNYHFVFERLGFIKMKKQVCLTQCNYELLHIAAKELCQKIDRGNGGYDSANMLLKIIANLLELGESTEKIRGNLTTYHEGKRWMSLTVSTEYFWGYGRISLTYGGANLASKDVELTLWPTK